MWPTQHFLIGIIPAIVWYGFTYDWFSTLLFMSANIIIDSDHFISLAILDRNFNISYNFNKLKGFHFNGVGEYKEKLFCFFHTVEVLFAISILSYFYPVFIPIFYGMAFHTMSDIVTVGWKNSKKIFFLSFFILKYLRGGYNV